MLQKSLQNFTFVPQHPYWTKPEHSHLN